jgi:hypothetical protein
MGTEIEISLVRLYPVILKTEVGFISSTTNNEAEA